MSSGVSRVVDRLDGLDDFGYRVYRRLFDSDGDLVSDLERTLTQAAISEPVEMYLSRALAVGLLVGGAVWLFGFSVAALVTPWPAGWPALLGRAAQMAAVTGAVGSLGFGITLGAFVARPYLRAGRREREIDALLPDAVSYMYALSTGNLNQVEIIEAMAQADDTYGEVAREFQHIVRQTEYFDVGYRTAIREQALVTPSDALEEFLTDMLSIINSGGDMTDFLDDKKDKHMRTAKQRQEDVLETLELFGELYIALSLFPLLLIIVLVIMGMMGTGKLGLLYATVYGLIPIGNLGFLVLVSMVKRDDPGDGVIATEGSTALRDQNADAEPVVRSVAGRRLFDRIERRERLHEVLQRVARPHVFFRERPLYVLSVTVPLTIVVFGYAMMSGATPTSWAGLVERPVIGTVYYLYVPVFLNVLPLVFFYEWGERTRRPITGRLSDTLRKLSSANDTGLTLFESLETVAETSTGRLAAELDAVCAKVRYGKNLREALIEFNNGYRIPRLARTVKLIAKAQETSSRITSVLTTAAQASENQDELERERRSRTRMQVVIIVMTYLTLLAVVVVLKTQFIDVMAEVMASTEEPIGINGSMGLDADRSVLALLLFHAVTIQAVLSGVISGYIRETNLLGGLKFVVSLAAVTLCVWVVLG